MLLLYCNSTFNAGNSIIRKETRLSSAARTYTYMYIVSYEENKTSLNCTLSDNQKYVNFFVYLLTNKI